jgi:hypothetical protein
MPGHLPRTNGQVTGRARSFGHPDLREQVIAPILVGVRSPRRGRKPATWTSVARDYEKIRFDMQTLFQAKAWASAPPDRQHLVNQDFVSV